MKLPVLSAIFLIFFILTIGVNLVTVLAQSTFQVKSANLTLYRDGLAHCKQELSLGELQAEIELPLLSESPQNILLLDENMTAIDYKVTGNSLKCYTLGAKSLLVEYDTLLLTKKEAEVWTLTTNYQYNLTVRLPLNSTVIYLSKSPLAIETKDNSMTLSLSTGDWEISYVLPVLAPDDFPDQSENTDDASRQLPLEYIAIAAIAVVAVTVVALVLYGRTRGFKAGKILKANPQLAREDRAVIQFLAEEGGKAFEAELRQKFPDMPRTSLWRLVRRLERLDIVEIRKIGLENQVELKK